MKYLLLFLIFISNLASANDYLRQKHYKAYCLKLSDFGRNLENSERDYRIQYKDDLIKKQQAKEAAYATLEANIAALEAEKSELITDDNIEDFKHAIDIIYNNYHNSMDYVVQSTYNDCLKKYLLNISYYNQQYNAK